LSGNSAPESEMIVFDLDDTLYLERDYVASGFAALEPIVQTTFGVAGFSSTAWELFLGGQRGDIFDKALAALGVHHDAALVAELVGAYRTHEPAIELLADAHAVLARLRDSGRSLGVLTDGPESSQRAKVKALGLDALTDRVIITDAYGTGFGKPHPRGFLEFVSAHRCDRFTYVADNPRKDFSAPHDLGWRTIRVRRDGGLHQHVAHGPDVDDVVPDLSDTFALLT
jgi:putative hydrolase of the HAD superfamily